MRAGLAVMVVAASSSAWAGERSVALAVQNMSCAACPLAVRTALKTVAGIKDVKVDLARRTAVVTFDDTQTTVDQLAEASRLAGFPATRKD